MRWKKTNRVMTVGVQSMADPTWRLAYEYIRPGNIGKVLHGPDQLLPQLATSASGGTTR